MDFRRSVGFIGGGNMAEALAAGIVRKGTVPAPKVWVAEPRPDRRSYLASRYGVRVTADNLEAAGSSGTLFLAVKPQVLSSVLPSLAPGLPAGGLVLSIAAGFPLRKLEAALPGAAVIRSMPNTPALVGAGATVISPGAKATPAMTAWAKELFGSVGICLELPESQMDAVTGLSGSGPAYVFLLAEALEEAGVKAGLPRGEAGALARQTIFGAGRMMVEGDTPPGALRQAVTSPGGTTMEGLRALGEGGFSELLARAVAAAAARSKQLGEG